MVRREKRPASPLRSFATHPDSASGIAGTRIGRYPGGFDGSRSGSFRIREKECFDEPWGFFQWTCHPMPISCFFKGERDLAFPGFGGEKLKPGDAEHEFPFFPIEGEAVSLIPRFQQSPQQLLEGAQVIGLF